MSRFSSLNVCAVVASMLAVLIITSHSFGQAVVHVDGDNGSVNPSGQGDSWAEAYKYLQDGLDRADELLEPGSGIDTVEIWVAAIDVDPSEPYECGQGAYRPDLGASVTEGDYNESFELRDNVELYGGFPPGGGDWDQRHTDNHETILTGQIYYDCDHSKDGAGGDEHCADCDIASVVVTATNLDDDAVLDGFTVQSVIDPATVEDDPRRGMIVTDASPEIKDCTFTKNESLTDGAAILIDNAGLPFGHPAVEIRDSHFVANIANNGGAIDTNESNVHVLKCVFQDNFADQDGGAIDAFEGEVVVSHTLIENNEADIGGAIHVGESGNNFDEGSLRVLDSVIKRNEAEEAGGIKVDKVVNIEIINSTIAYNSASSSSSAGGVHLEGLCLEPDSYVVLNSILYYNQSNGAEDHDAQFLDETNQCGLTVEYSNIQTGPGEPLPGSYVASHDDEPGFVDDRPYRVELECDSPNIDVGEDNYAPLDEYNIRDLDNPDPTAVAPDFFFDDRIVDGLKDGRAVVDIGADEYQPGDTSCSCSADLTGDCEVGGADLGTLLSAWGPCADPNNCPEDLTGDGEVGGADLGTLLSAWGDCPKSRAECDTGGGTSTMSGGGGDNMFYEWLIYASYDEIVDWLDMMGYWPE